MKSLLCDIFNEKIYAEMTDKCTGNTCSSISESNSISNIFINLTDTWYSIVQTVFIKLGHNITHFLEKFIFNSMIKNLYK